MIKMMKIDQSVRSIHQAEDLKEHLPQSSIDSTSENNEDRCKKHLNLEEIIEESPTKPIITYDIDHKSTPIVGEGKQSSESSSDSFEEIFDSEDTNPNFEVKSKESTDKPTISNVPEDAVYNSMGKKEKESIDEEKIVKDTSPMLESNVKASPEIRKDSDRHILPKVNRILSTKKFILPNDKKENESKVGSKSSSKVLSDFVFIVIGILFFIKWAQFIIPAVPLLIVFFASVILLQLWMKNFKM